MGIFTFTKKKSAAVGASAAVVLSIGALITPWEGLSLRTYKDPIGILTYCYGETRGAVPGKTYSVDECKAILTPRVQAFEKAVSVCLPNYATLPVPTQAAVLSLTYNIGEGAVCRSTMVKYLKAGDIKAACNEFPKFNRAGGRVLKGLVNRRAAERAVCMKGVS